MMVAKVYLPILFPITFFICLLAHKIDVYLGYTHGFFPLNYGLAVFLFVTGAILWIWTYEQLVRLGKRLLHRLQVERSNLRERNLCLQQKSLRIRKALGFVVGVALNPFSFFCSHPSFCVGLSSKKWFDKNHNSLKFSEKSTSNSRKEVPLFSLEILPLKITQRGHHGYYSDQSPRKTSRMGRN